LSPDISGIPEIGHVPGMFFSGLPRFNLANQALQQTAAAILVPESSLSLSAAAAAELAR
jgi:hypothetical protein